MGFKTTIITHIFCSHNYVVILELFHKANYVSHSVKLAVKLVDIIYDLSQTESTLFFWTLTAVEHFYFKLIWKFSETSGCDHLY